MASQADLERLVGHALLAGEGFRQQLLENPEQAAAAVGIDLTYQQVAQIQGLSTDMLDALAGTIERLGGLDAQGPGAPLWEDAPDP